MIAVAEAGTGFGFLAVVIAYLPTHVRSLFAAGIEHLAAGCARRFATHRCRTASPDSHFPDSGVLSQYLRDWESWSAQLMESHLSYPVLCYFRSQHDNQSWLAAFTAVLDVSALMIAYGTGALNGRLS